MGFSKQVKNEILNTKDISKQECLAFLCGLVYSSADFEIENLKIKNCTITSEVENLSQALNKYIQIVFNKDVILTEKESFKIGKMQYYTINVDSDFAKILLKNTKKILKINSDYQINEKVDDSVLSDELGLKGFMRGAYIGCGTSSIKLDEKNRTTTGYHLEFNNKSYTLLHEISEILAQFDIIAKLTKRKNLYVLYIKDAEQVSNMLALMGASEAVLNLQNEIITRQMRNKINRQNNCYTSNYTKTLDASFNQLEAIKIIDKEIGVYNLPEDLCQVALLRLANTEESLDQLLKLSKMPLTKSALNYKFQKLIKLSKKFRRD